MKPVVLDGAKLEGGGQLVRVALALSAITSIPVTIHSIRASRAPQRRSNSKQSGRGSGRPSNKVEGGLKESHLAALQYLAYQCNAHVEGAEIGSREVTFIPGAGYSPGRGGSRSKKAGNGLVDFEGNVIELQNPGSVWLIVQAILPYLIFRKLENGEGKEVELTIRGGTNVSKSMSGEYVQLVLLPMLRRIGLPEIEVDIIKRGWAGNAPAIGEVKLRVPSVPAGGFRLKWFYLNERGKLENITVKIVAGSTHAREYLKAECGKVLAEHFGEDVAISFLPDEDSGDARRLYVLLVARRSTGCLLGRDFLGTGRLAKNVSEEEKILQNACRTVVSDLKHELDKGSCVDEFLEDQLVIFQALAEGVSEVYGPDCLYLPPGEEREGSLHTRTVRWVCSELLKHCKDGVRFYSDNSCRGLGWNIESAADVNAAKLANLDLG